MISNSQINDILFLGNYEYTFKVGQYEILFNMASVGEIQDQINATYRGEINEKAARMATALKSVNGYMFNDTSTNNNPLINKANFLRGLKEPVFNLFWDEYNVALMQQFKEFQEYIEKGKKSVPIPS